MLHIESAFCEAGTAPSLVVASIRCRPGRVKLLELMVDQPPWTPGHEAKTRVLASSRTLSTRTAIAVAAVVALVAFVSNLSDVAGADQAPGIQQSLSAATGSAGSQLLAQARSLARQSGISVGNETFTVDNIGSPAGQIRSNMSDLAKLITAGSYVAGFGFAVAAIAKFVAHKDDPRPVPISLPIALLFIAAALIFIPAIFGHDGLTGPIDPRTAPSVVTGTDILAIVTPALQQAKAAGLHRERARGPLLTATASADLRAALQARGLSGGALDAFAQVAVLAADALVAGARA
jgi:hypothetical protein